MRTRGIFYFGKFVVMGIAFAALFTYIVMMLWNWLVPELFNGPVINYWQTLGVFILSKILFTGFGHHGKDGSHWKNKSWKHDHYKSFWKEKFEEKMNKKMSAEDPGKMGTE